MMCVLMTLKRTVSTMQVTDIRGKLHTGKSYRFYGYASDLRNHFRLRPTVAQLRTMFYVLLTYTGR